MKTIIKSYFRVLLACCLASVIFSGCKKDTEGEKRTPLGQDVLYFRFKFIQENANRSQDSLIFAVYYIQLGGNGGNGHASVEKEFTMCGKGADLNGIDTTAFHWTRYYYSSYFNRYELMDADSQIIVSSRKVDFIDDYTLAPIEIRY